MPKVNLFKSASIIILLFTVPHWLIPYMPDNMLFEASEQLKIHFILLSIIFLGICVIFKKWRLSGLFLFGIILNLMIIIYPISLDTKNSYIINNEKFTLMSYNKWIDNHNIDAITDLILKHNPDIIWLQEVDQRIYGKLKTKLVGLYAFNYGDFPDHTSDGQLLFSRYPISKQHSVINHFTIRFLNDKFDLIGVHFSSPKSAKRIHIATKNMHQMGIYIKKHVPKARPLIIAGDMNSAYWHPRVKKLLAMARIQIKTYPKLTWPSYWPIFLRFPIDHIFFTDHFCIHDYKTGDASGSDHLPIIGTFRLCYQ